MSKRISNEHTREDVNLVLVQGSADEAILKSLAEDTEHEFDSEELAKAMNRSGLVQKEVQVKGKNGQTFTRKQWVKSGEDKSSDGSSSTQEDDSKNKETKKPEKKEHWTKAGSSAEAKAQIAQMLASGKSRTDLMSDFKNQGVTWKESPNEGINWMRAAMAIQKHMNEGGSTQSQDKINDTDKTTEQPKQENKQKSSVDNSKGKLQVGQTVYCDQIGNGKSKVTVTGLDGENGKITVKNGRGSEYDVPMSSLYSSKEDAENGENSIVEQAAGGKSEKPQSVIGKDYTKLTTEDEADSIEGEAHNMLVGALNSEGKKQPTAKQVKEKAADLMEKQLKVVISSHNADEISSKFALAKQFNKLSGNDKYLATVEQFLKDQLSSGSHASQSQKCDALSKLLNDKSEYEYISYSGDDVTARGTSGASVSIEPLSRGNFKCWFNYADGVSHAGTYDSLDSVKKASEKFLKDEDKQSKTS